MLDSEVGWGPSSGVLACKVLGAVMLQGGPLSSTRQRRALAALVVAHGEVVSADRLADIVWDGDPPGSMNALQTYMSRLRTVLGVDSIQTRPPGYALALPIDAVDAWRFETLVDEARSMPPVGALDLLDEALGLWRGAAYAEFAHEEFARAEAVRLEELRAAAAVARLDALIGVGRADDAAADALHLIEADPFRESVWDRRMRALHASGRTVDALRVFQDYRRLLADELGLDPSPELVALERALLTPQSPKESADTTLGSVPGNLPVDSTALVDRVEIDPLVEGSRGVWPSGTVTFLFTDMVGSTAVASGLDPGRCRRAAAPSFRPVASGGRRERRGRGEVAGRWAHGGVRFSVACVVVRGDHAAVHRARQPIGWAAGWVAGGFERWRGEL